MNKYNLLNRNNDNNIDLRLHLVDIKLSSKLKNIFSIIHNCFYSKIYQREASIYSKISQNTSHKGIAGMANILGIGNSLLDHVSIVTQFPLENSEQRAQMVYQQLGGNCTNTLNVLSQCHHTCYIVTTAANDAEGKTLIQALQQRKIDTQHIQTLRQGSTPKSQVWISSETASRTIVHHRDLAEVSFEHFANIEIEHFDWLHFEGRNVDNLLSMINIAKCFLTTQTISIEVEKDRAGIEQVFDKANVLFFSQAYAQGKGFENADEFLHSMRQQAPQAHLFCTWGADGAYCLPHAADVAEHRQELTSITVIDTLGAGDTFNAGVIDAMLRGHNPIEALELAVALASKKVAQHGIDNLFANAQQKILVHSREITPHKVKVIQLENRKHSIACVKMNDKIKAYENNCPHADVPLDSLYKIEIDPRALTLKCSVHNAFFRVEDGYCVAGPCEKQSLKPVPIVVDDQGWVYLTD